MCSRKMSELLTLADGNPKYVSGGVSGSPHPHEKVSFTFSAQCQELFASTEEKAKVPAFWQESRQRHVREIKREKYL